MAFVMSSEGKSLNSPGNKLMVKLALLDPGPILLIIFSITGVLPVCFSVYSSATYQAASSILEMIESVIISLVPCGIVSDMATLSLAIVGKNEVRTTLL